MWKKTFGILFLLLLCYLTYHYKSLFYGLGQAKGQIQLLLNTEEIEDLLKQKDFPDSTKAKFRYIQSVRDFAQSEIGLSESDNYTTFYDQKGEPILWVVTASPEFKIEAYEWEFPIAGGFKYKGFFDLEKTKQEAERMESLGYDTEIDEVSAWSTLGFLRDPILSSMLQKEEGRLAELIIHELTHATIFRKGESEFNENLATFVGQEGAIRFLRKQFGEDSKEEKDYLRILERKRFFKTFILAEKAKLDSLYQSFTESDNIKIKRQLKQEQIESMKQRLLVSSYYTDKEVGKKRLENFNPNNAFFSGLSTYHAQQVDFRRQLEDDFNGNLKALIQSLKD